MKMQKNRVGLIERFCQFLGRQNTMSDFLDYFSGWFLLKPAFAFGSYSNFQPKLPDKNAVNSVNKGQALFMARPTQPHAGSDVGRAAPTAPSQPHQGAPRSEPVFPWRVLLGPFGWLLHQQAKDDAKKHATVPCSNARYKGMHGQPCKYAGGSDTKCPAGTTSGWFWAYDVPSLGRIYYVDCCGAGGTASDVWCEWSTEPNWCAGWGRAANKGITDYNCTLAILESDMNVVDLGGGKYEVGGVDP